MFRQGLENYKSLEIQSFLRFKNSILINNHLSLMTGPYIPRSRLLTFDSIVFVLLQLKSKDPREELLSEVLRRLKVGKYNKKKRINGKYCKKDYEEMSYDKIILKFIRELQGKLQ